MGGCGHAFCPAAIRIVWSVDDWRFPEMGGAIGVGSSAVRRRAEKLALPQRARQRPPKRISKATLVDAWYDENTPLNEVAKSLGISVPCLMRRAKVGHKLLNRKMGRKKTMPDRYFAEMWRFGVSTEAMAAHHRCSGSTILNLARELDLQDRSRWQYRLFNKTVQEFNRFKFGTTYVATVMSQKRYGQKVSAGASCQNGAGSAPCS